MKNKIHIERLKAIRPFVEFNYNINSIKKGNLSSYDKRKIKEYYDAINSSTAKPHYAYTPRSKERKKLAVEFANAPNLKQLKTVFIPVPRQGMKPKLKFKKDGLTVNTGYVQAYQVSFNKKRLLQDRTKEVERTLKKFPVEYSRFTVQCGEFEYLAAVSRDKADSEIAKLMEAYRDEKNNNYFGNWLNGLYGYQFKNQADPDAYFAAKSRARKKSQQDRRNAKKRIKRQKDKENNH